MPVVTMTRLPGVVSQIGRLYSVGRLSGSGGGVGDSIGCGFAVARGTDEMEP